MIISFLGPPGVGKGTIAEMFENKLNIKHVSIGELLRKQVRKKTLIGKKIKNIIDNGRLVPDEIPMKLLKPFLKKNIIVDGFPRRLSQLKLFEKISSFDKVVFFNAKTSTLVSRISGRRSCSNKKCEAIYHIKNMPPKKRGICDECGHRLYQRKDDKPLTLRKRIKLYKEKTLPVINYYRKKGLLVEVNAEPLPKEIFKETKKKLKIK